MMHVEALAADALDRYRQRLGELRGDFEALRGSLSPRLIGQIEETFRWLEQPEQERRAAVEHVMQALGLP